MVLKKSKSGGNTGNTVRRGRGGDRWSWDRYSKDAGFISKKTSVRGVLSGGESKQGIYNIKKLKHLYTKQCHECSEIKAKQEKLIIVLFDVYLKIVAKYIYQLLGDRKDCLEIMEITRDAFSSSEKYSAISSYTYSVKSVTNHGLKMTLVKS